jgi:hypothetical protein
MSKEQNPYLKDGRLAEVIAAITALANYRFYKLSFKAAAERISNDPENAKRWANIFKEHPEFFRVSGDKVSLVWRRQNPKTFDTQSHSEITLIEFSAMEAEKKEKISRRPLNPEETTALIDVAVRLHERAIENKRIGRWWIPVLSAILAFLGAIFGAFLGG